ncbi:MAG: diaminopimelate decarboxylase [Deltaproteobacteria bacterium]|jgi:diaminopimelate decarboxylase|nr:diaminopimelate decarboxylase [Deltaproteobacteria bacterium]
MASPWWSRDGLEVRDGRLHIAGHDAEEIAHEHGTPLYVYDSCRVEINLRRLADALERAGVRHRLLFAFKANRHPAILSRIRKMGNVGIDACSPNEVSAALEAGWQAEEISYTGTSLSRQDLDQILPHPLQLNIDSLSALEKVGSRCPGRTIGLRINPGVGEYSATPTASGTKPTKFGIYPDQFEQALEVARRHELHVRGIHFHMGSGWLHDELPVFHAAVCRAAEMARRITELEYVNVGGGIGVRLVESHRAPDLDAYAEGLAKHLNPLHTTVLCEPGDFAVRDGGVFLVEAVGVDVKGGTTFVGVAAGFNAFAIPVLYQDPQEVVLCRAADAPPALTCALAGHINEATDLLADECRLPEVREGDILALLNAGGYGPGLASHHCSRPHAARLAL